MAIFKVRDTICYQLLVTSIHHSSFPSVNGLIGTLSFLTLSLSNRSAGLDSSISTPISFFITSLPSLPLARDTKFSVSNRYLCLLPHNIQGIHSHFLRSCHSLELEFWVARFLSAYSKQAERG